MKESLVGLLDLQKIDLEIDNLRGSQETYPSEIERLKLEIANSKSVIDLRQERTAELEKSRRLMEGELEVISADLKKHQDRLYEVQSNREYDALQQEIEALRAKMDQNETGILEGIEEVDTLKSRIDEEASLHKELESGHKVKIKELQGKLNSVEEDVRAWDEKRTVIESKIERKALSVYNRIRKVLKGGLAVVKVEKGACGGCFRQLPPQRRVEVRRQDKLMRCENCGRIFVWNGEE